MILDRFRLHDKVAIVTGASSGIGRGCALAFAEAGADVVCVARRADRLEAVASEIRRCGRRALAVPCDVNDAAQIGEVVARARELGRIDVVVNVAGGTPPSPAMYLSAEELDAAFHFNVTSAFLMIKAALTDLAKAKGAVVNVSSALSHMVEPGFTAYSAAKAALSHMTRVLGAELAPHVRVNALAVGATETEALSPLLEADEKLRRRMTELTPMARLGKPEDIACAALYLASDAASWMTGKVLEIDGGTVASNWPIKIPSGL